MAEDDARELGNDGNEHLLYVADDVRKQILVRRRANTDIGNLSKGSQYQYNMFVFPISQWKADGIRSDGFPGSNYIITTFLFLLAINQ